MIDAFDLLGNLSNVRRTINAQGRVETWNNGKIATPLAKGQIPAVLGASYCTSKTYWNKLKDLQGLIHYGCEEAYISIKAWMEGGGCHLIDDIVIGHLYRKNAPYRIDTVLNNYNYYLIAETLLPPLLCAKAHAAGITLNKQLYLSVMKEMVKNEDTISAHPCPPHSRGSQRGGHTRCPRRDRHGERNLSALAQPARRQMPTAGHTPLGAKSFCGNLQNHTQQTHRQAHLPHRQPSLRQARPRPRGDAEELAQRQEPRQLLSQVTA